MLGEFKEFIAKGNMLDLAVGVALGAAFSKIVDSVVKDLITPILGIFGNVDFKNAFFVLSSGKSGETTFESYDAATKAGANVLGYGAFLTSAINFLIVGFALFLIVKAVNRARRLAPPAPEGPAATVDQNLFTEIRDLLRERPT